MRVLSDLSSAHFPKLLDKREKEAEAQSTDILQYYLDNFPEVYVLICDKCHKKLAIEYLDSNKPNAHHHNSRQVIPIDSAMKSYRPRLDGVMGYRCGCGNDTRVGRAEAGIVPVVKILDTGTYEIPRGGMEIHPHHFGLVHDKMVKSGLVPTTKQSGADFITETFRVRRLK